MHHVAVVLHDHEVVDLDRAVLADAAEVVATEVDQHHVLSSLLLVGKQLARVLSILLGGGAARARARDRSGRDPAAADGDQRLRAGAGDLKVTEVEVVHVRRRVHGPQTAIDREAADRRLRRPALRRHHLKGVAGIDVVDDPGDVGLEVLARHVRDELRSGAVSDLRRERCAWQWTGEDLPDRLDLYARGVRIVARVRDDRDRALEVVERDHRVGQHQRQIGEPELIRVGLAERFDGTHEVVGEHADGAAAEWQFHALRLLRADFVELPLDQRVWVAGIAQRPAQYLARAVADEADSDRRAPARPIRAGSTARPAPAARSFRKAETGVSVSSIQVSVTGTHSATALIKHPPRVGERQRAAGEQHREVVEDVGRFVGDALVGLLARGARNLLRLLLHLLADQGRVGQQRGGVGAVRPF